MHIYAFKNVPKISKLFPLVFKFAFFCVFVAFIANFTFKFCCVTLYIFRTTYKVFSVKFNVKQKVFQNILCTSQ